jgi:hypothetical protein
MDRRITVKGIGHVTATPDYVIINMTIDAVNKKYEKAVEEATEKINTLSDKLVKAGFDKDSLKTVDYKVNVNTEFRTNRKGATEQIRNGYTCVHRMKLAFDFNNEKLSNAINAVTTCLSDPRLNIVFTVKDEEAVKDELLKSAGANARRRAEILCQSAGGKLGNLVTVSYNWNEISIMSPTRFDNTIDTAELYDCATMPNIAPQSIQPDDINLTDNALFVWEII